MAWQKCPVCDGSGAIFDALSASASRVCPTCEGTRIISEWTGKPPVKDAKEKEPNDYDKFLDFARDIFKDRG